VSKPNLIVIMTDQQRWDTIRALGHGHMHTPHMDALCGKGVVFRQAVCNGATCIASRASLFTGLYPHNTGVYQFNRWAQHRSWMHDLSDSGYYCVNIGKMHVSPRDDAYGFDERVIVENPSGRASLNGGPEDDWGRQLSLHGITGIGERHLNDPDWHKRLQCVPWEHDEALQKDVFIGNSALAWIDRHRPQSPVFLQIGFTGPHEPYDPLPRHLDLYKDVEIPEPAVRDGDLDGKPPQHKAHQEFFATAHSEARVPLTDASVEEIREMRRHYFASITTIDEKLGQIMEALEAKGYLENAVVVFTADHGDMLGDHRLAYKWLMYEGSVRVPIIVWDTRKKRTGESDALASLIDIGPTLLAAAGLEVPGYLEGRDLLGDEPAPEYVFCEDNYLTMVRGERYKLVYYTEQEDIGELYDLQNDPHEFVNLFDDPAHSAIKAQMKEALLHWLLRSNYLSSGFHVGFDSKPRVRPGYGPCLRPAGRPKEEK
jgi:arylsulfatase